MNFRVLLLALSGVIATLVYELLFTAIAPVHPPIAHTVLSFGIFEQMTAFVIILLLPVSIFLGGSNRKNPWRWLPQLALLIALAFWSLPELRSYPYRTALFLACAFGTLPFRWWVERFWDGHDRTRS